MKNNLIFFPILFACFTTFSSCTKFLQKQPVSSLDITSQFSTPALSTAAVNALYKGMGVTDLYAAGDAYGGSSIMIGGYLSGFFDDEQKGIANIVPYYQHLTLNAINVTSTLENIWLDCYSEIAAANNAIKYVPTTPDMDDSTKIHLVAQAKFFRAQNYFYLVKMFGDVPLITAPYISLNQNLYLSRTPSAQVYDTIVSDLVYASQDGVLNNKTFTQNGYKITQGTAQMLLANVYLTMSGYPLQSNHYADAATIAKKIISSRVYYMINNTTDISAYNIIRTMEDNPESLYAIEYDAVVSNSGWRPAYTLPAVATGWSWTKTFSMAYSITNNAYGPSGTSQGGPVSGHPYMKFYDSTNDIRGQNRQLFHYQETFPIAKLGGDTTINFSPCPFLWYDSVAIFQTGSGGQNLPVYRYPELLLIVAEAIAQSEGVTADAVNYLAQVRARGYTNQSQADIQAGLSGLSVSDFIQEVWKERLRELALDNVVWDDIQRTHQYPQPGNSLGDVNFVNVIGATNYWNATYQAFNLLLPIPNTERQRNKNLTQNPGY